MGTAFHFLEELLHPRRLVTLSLEIGYCDICIVTVVAILFCNSGSLPQGAQVASPAARHAHVRAAHGGPAERPPPSHQPNDVAAEQLRGQAPPVEGGGGARHQGSRGPLLILGGQGQCQFIQSQLWKISIAQLCLHIGAFRTTWRGSRRVRRTAPSFASRAWCSATRRGTAPTRRPSRRSLATY